MDVLSRCFCGMPASTTVFKAVKNININPPNTGFLQLGILPHTNKIPVLTALNHVVKANGTSSQQQGLRKTKRSWVGRNTGPDYQPQRILGKVNSSHNHGSVENGMFPNFSLLSFRVIFHFYMIMGVQYHNSPIQMLRTMYASLFSLTFQALELR